MQRWWFLDEKNGSASSLTSSPGTSTKKTKPSKPVGDRRHKFRVLVTYELLKDETIAVTGNCEALGNWEPEHCVQMQLEDEFVIIVSSIQSR
ncbi:AAEL014346-PA [Aedes aegypti]|uniref:AAEL014346-PA n=1 Tax=Aedes aegypti TaxID=7159 RepID=Q16GJ8_AEDAE|nr:AAEL014346-PA [Aedes aegypti]